MNSTNQVGRSDVVAQAEENGIKEEVIVKREPLECVVCVARSPDTADIFATTTTCGTALADYLGRFTQTTLTAAASKHICKSCIDLINILEQAELEYLKLKETFEAIISKNPFFEVQEQPTTAVKVEIDYEASNAYRNTDDSEDEPLALAKKKRNQKTVKQKKKVYPPKRKPRAKTTDKNDSWSCGTCDAAGVSGGALTLAAHMLAKHTLPDDHNPALRDVKKEESVDGSDNSHVNNGLDSIFKTESDVDDSDDYMPDDWSDDDRKPVRKRASVRAGRPTIMVTPMPRKKREKVVHPCDQCDSKFKSLGRLEAHREKHSAGKPPYICEVCGARYKHKRACDIHVALHKGISDWKCEECNKLFPSKNALQRHNNIHTGKLNYQCDLCGKSFIHTSSFKMHKLSHSGVKPHACDVCGLALMTRSHLKRHKRVHSGEKRHECSLCGKRFSERYNLVAHAKSHEPSAGGEPVPEAAAAPRRRLFRCPYCPERFERRYMLERHTSSAHGCTLERAPPTPRNTMSKLLKAQAQARAHPAPPPPPPTTPADLITHSGQQHPPPTNTPASDTMVDPKEERSPDSRSSSVVHKLQLSSPATTVSVGSWSGAYAAEFGLRHDFPH